ncbi:PGPGW domain-containing protein [Candidatus Thioglobus sp.]|uniref:PGPGW domain-containing protein n=1 Tax=Candidatus Thioglobus sp. TaxID=2026721 RepID=UPI0025B9A6ED|nr:PGPGW domain-containing protein [Candidatus Thioglobus sp.]
MLTLVSQYEEIFILVGIVSAVVFVATLLLTPYLLGLIPADYFSANYAYQVKRKTLLCLLKTTVKTFVGVLLVLAGIIMLVTPGQGFISIILGIFLMEFPGKRQLEIKFINHNPTFKTLNWLRDKAGKTPFIR